MNNKQIHVTANSKEVRPGSIFFALKGAKFDGHDFIEDAIKAGASQVYSENHFDHPKVTAIGSLARKKLAELASTMYGDPTLKLKMIGVTGTSGKTTTTYLIHHILNSAGYSCARIGTNGTAFKGVETETSNTTPDALTLQKYFSEVLNEGATHVVMEVSSHALHQDRVWGIAWDAVAFLNLSPEHMDYHPTLDHYFESKALLFSEHVQYSLTHGKTTQLSVNLANEYGTKLFSRVPHAQTHSLAGSAKNIHTTPHGIAGEIKITSEWHGFECPLFGTFQIENILAAVTVCTQMGLNATQILAALKNFPGVPGRMEFIPNSKEIFVFVDYAHKPEALEKVLLAIQDPKVKIITVFGCGGDRDKTKRPVMGAIAARLSDTLILTSDNPRSEDPLTILQEIQAGVTDAQKRMSARASKVETIPDREHAIKAAIQYANVGDIVLIAGKGHETYQIIENTKRDFDDRKVARTALS